MILGLRGLERLGRKKWEKRVYAITKRFVSALVLDEVVFGGGNAKKLKKLPEGCRLGDNANARLRGGSYDGRRNRSLGVHDCETRKVLHFKLAIANSGTRKSATSFRLTTTDVEK